MINSGQLPKEQAIFPYETSTTSGGKILIIAPHPDDETLGCGGTILLHRQKGDLVHVVFLTDGSRGDFDQRYTAEDYVEIRRREAMAAARHLGDPDLEFWNFTDREIDFLKLKNKLISFLQSFRPDLIYVPSPIELNPDHRAAAYCLCKALEKIRMEVHVAFYEVGTPMIPNILVDITKVMSHKEAAARAYSSQMHVVNYFEIAQALNRFRSLTVSNTAQYAEAFILKESEEIVGEKLWSVFPRGKRFNILEMDSPVVSVVIRTKDRPKLLKQALTSLVNQTYKNFEVIIVNDGGVEIEELLDEFQNDLPIKYLTNRKPVGRSAAGNQGLQIAIGQYINFLDDDDLLYDRHLQVLIDCIQKNPKIGLVYSDCNLAFYQWREDGSLTMRSASKRLFKSKDFDRERLYQSNYIPIMTALFRKNLLTEVGYLDQDLEVFEDWDLWIRMANFTDFLHVNEVTCEYRIIGSRQYNYMEGQLAIYDKHHELYDPDDFKRWLHQMQVENDLLQLELESLRKERELSWVYRILRAVNTWRSERNLLI